MDTRKRRVKIIIIIQRRSCLNNASKKMVGYLQKRKEKYFRFISRMKEK